MLAPILSPIAIIGFVGFAAYRIRRNPSAHQETDRDSFTDALLTMLESAVDSGFKAGGGEPSELYRAHRIGQGMDRTHVGTGI